MLDNKYFLSENLVGGQGTVDIFLIREDFFFIQKVVVYSMSCAIFTFHHCLVKYVLCKPPSQLLLKQNLTVKKGTNRFLRVFLLQILQPYWSSSISNVRDVLQPFLLVRRGNARLFRLAVLV